MHNDLATHFVVVDRLRAPAHKHLSNADRLQLTAALAGVKVDPMILHSVVVDYLSTLRSSSPSVTKSLVDWIRSTPGIELELLTAARDAIIFSSLTSTTAPETFTFLLTNLAPLQWNALRQMRRELFQVGADLAIEVASDARDRDLRLALAKENAEAFNRATSPQK